MEGEEPDLQRAREADSSSTMDEPIGTGKFSAAVLGQKRRLCTSEGQGRSHIN